MFQSLDHFEIDQLKYLSIYLYQTLTCLTPRAKYVDVKVAIVTWLWRHEQVMCRVYKAIRWSQRNSHNYSGNLIVIIFSRDFPFRKFKWFWLSTNYTIQLFCFTCIWNHPFNSLEQSSWSWFGIVLNDLSDCESDSQY